MSRKSNSSSCSSRDEKRKRSCKVKTRSRRAIPPPRGSRLYPGERRYGRCYVFFLSHEHDTSSIFKQKQCRFHKGLLLPRFESEEEQRCPVDSGTFKGLTHPNTINSEPEKPTALATTNAMLSRNCLLAVHGVRDPTLIRSKFNAK